MITAKTIEASRFQARSKKEEKTLDSAGRAEICEATSTPRPTAAESSTNRMIEGGERLSAESDWNSGMKIRIPRSTRPSRPTTMRRVFIPHLRGRSRLPRAANDRRQDTVATCRSAAAARAPRIGDPSFHDPDERLLPDLPSVACEVCEIVQVVEDHRRPERAAAQRHVAEDGAQDAADEGDRPHQRHRVDPEDVPHVQQAEEE